MHDKSRKTTLIISASFFSAAILLLLSSQITQLQQMLNLILGTTQITGSLVISYALYKNLISPITMFLVPWGMSTLLHGYLLSSYFLSPMVPVTFLAISIASISFTVGAALQLARSGSHIERDSSVSMWNITRLKSLVLILFLIGFAAGIYQTVKGGGIIYFIQNMNETRFQFWRTESGYFFLMLSSAVVLATYYQVLAGRRSFGFIVISFLAILFMILPGSRSLAFLTLGQVVLLLYLNLGKININKSYSVYAISLVLSLVFIFAVIGDARGQGNTLGIDLIDEGKAQFSYEYAQLVNPYLYLTTPIQNLQVNLLKPSPFLGGVISIKPVLNWLQMDRVIDYKTALYNPQYNVSTFLVDYYYDFGWYGIVFVPFLIGYLSSFVYLRSSKSSIYMLITTLLLYTLAVSIFSNYLNKANVWIGFIVLIITRRFCLLSSKNNTILLNKHKLPKQAFTSKLNI